jgi:hypothetical protein
MTAENCDVVFGITPEQDEIRRFLTGWDSNTNDDLDDDLEAVHLLNEAFAGTFPVVTGPERWEIAADLIASTDDGHYDGYEIKICSAETRFWLCADIQTVMDTDPVPAMHLIAMAVDTANDMLAEWRSHGNGHS